MSHKSSPTNPVLAGLNDRHKHFVLNYCICNNATQAAIRSGYSRKSARFQGSRMLRNVDIQRAIQQVRDEAILAELKDKALASEKARQIKQIMSFRWLEEIETIAFTRISDVVEFDDKGIRLKEGLTPQQWSAIWSLKVKRDEDGSIRVLHLTMRGRLGALRLLAQHLGLFENPPRYLPVEDPFFMDCFDPQQPGV